MQLDSFTLLVASSGLLVLLGSAFVVLWTGDRQSHWLLWWGVPFIVNGLTLTFFMSPDWETDFIAIALGNAGRIFGLGCIWYGVRLFQGSRPPWGSITAISVVWIALCLYPPFIDNLTARIAVVSLISAVIAALTAWDLWRARGDGLRSRLPTMLVFASYTLFMIARVAVSGTAPFPVGSGPLDAVWFAGFVWLIVGHALFAAFLFLTMTMERREAEQRSFAMSDPLTGLMNRRAFGDFAQRLARRRTGMREPLGLLVLDLDRFKSINDKYGHEIGDKMLKAFADVAEECVRPTDQVFRMGGEEFCFVLPDTALADAIGVAERVRRTFEYIQIETPGGPAATTVSIGIAATQHAVDIDVLLAAADAAVYEAKARGRNRLVVAEPSTVLQGLADTVPLRRRA